MKDYFVAKSSSFAHTVGVGVCVLFSNCWDCPWGLSDSPERRLVWLNYTYCTCYPFEIAGLYNPRAMLWKGVGNLFPSAKVAVHSRHIIDSLGGPKKPAEGDVLRDWKARRSKSGKSWTYFASKRMKSQCLIHGDRPSGSGVEEKKREISRVQRDQRWMLPKTFFFLRRDQSSSGNRTHLMGTAQ